MIKYPFLSLLGFVALIVANAQPGNAQTISFGDATAAWARACTADIKKSCKVVKSNGEELLLCLTNSASPACQKATNTFLINRAARLKAQAGAPRHCKGDVKKLCSNFKEGQGRVLRCLMKGDRYRKVTKICKSWLKSAGWLDQISKKAN